MTLPTDLDVQRDLDAISALGVGMYCRTVPVRELTAADLARIEAIDVNTMIAKGGTVEWTNREYRDPRRIEFAREMFMLSKPECEYIYFAFTDGTQAVCQVTVDRALRDYSLTWIPKGART